MSDTVAAPPLAPNRGTIGRTLSGFLFARIHTGRLTIITPSGIRLTHAGTPGPEGILILRRWRTLRRLLFQGDVAFAESCLDGDWHSPDLPSLIELAAVNMPTLSDTFAGNAFQRLRQRLAHRLNANTRRGSRRNTRHHYDLGNDFYQTWLDGGMSYSSALFATPDQTLEAAQANKQHRVTTLLQTRPGQTVLEIGCGWGGLAEHLAREANCHVTAVTLSSQQLARATARSVPAASFLLQDYRDIAGQFDRIVSIEMMEAVGEAFWPKYFATLRDRLHPGGRAVIQAITIAEDKFAGYRRCTDFIQQYIFPGGMLPTLSEIKRQTERAGLQHHAVETFGVSYAHTLAEWRRRFHAAWPTIERLGFDSRFRRMWDYYLAYCEGGFRAGTIDVGLHVLTKPA